jgi:hypothetical protein
MSVFCQAMASHMQSTLDRPQRNLKPICDFLQRPMLEVKFMKRLSIDLR